MLDKPPGHVPRRAGCWDSTPTDPQTAVRALQQPKRHTALSEYSLSDDGRTADPDSERLIFFAQQPATNHNGGMIQFGPDGFLYLGLGDGGRSGDYYGHGQRPDTPLAALVRIHPDQVTSQVWWYGLRNPWRFWIDQPTGLVYIADVGQDAYEEVSIAPLSEPDLNFGWPITEGLHCYEPRQGCDPAGLTLPALEISHDDGGTFHNGGMSIRPPLPGCGHYFYSTMRRYPAAPWKGPGTDLRMTPPGTCLLGTDGSEEYVLTRALLHRAGPERRFIITARAIRYQQMSVVSGSLAHFRSSDCGAHIFGALLDGGPELSQVRLESAASVWLCPSLVGQDDMWVEEDWLSWRSWDSRAEPNPTPALPTD